jgi:hypothetical protein
VFWKTHGAAIGSPMPTGDRAGISIIALVGLFWVIGAGSASQYTAATAQQLAQPRAYIDAVMRQAPVPPAHSAMPAP